MTRPSCSDLFFAVPRSTRSFFMCTLGIHASTCMSRIIHNQRANTQILSLSGRNKSGMTDSKASGNGKDPANGPGNNNSPANGPPNGPGNGKGPHGGNGNGNGNGNGGQGTSTGNPSPSATPAVPPGNSGGGSGGSSGGGNGGGNTTSAGSGPSPSPNTGGNGSSPTSLPNSSPTTDTGGNVSSPPKIDSGGGNTSSQSGPQPGNGDSSPTKGASNDSAGSNMPATKTDKISDSSPSYRTTFSSYTYTSVFTSVTTISSGGQAYTSSFIFTSVGLTTIPVSGPSGVPGDGDSGATTNQTNTGAIVGAVIGSLVGLFLLLLLIFLYRRRRRDEVSFSMVNPLMEETADEQASRFTASSIQINMSHVTETDYSRYGAPSSPLASLFNKARHRSSQPFFRPTSRNFHDTRIDTQQTSTPENPFRDHPASPPVTITNPFADPDSDVLNVSGSAGTSSRLSTFTEISSMLLPSDYSGAEVEFSTSTTAFRQRNAGILNEAPAARSSEAIVEMARRLSEAPVLDISSTAAHARKSSELFPEMPNATPGPSRHNSTHREPPSQGSSRLTELYGTYPSEQSRRSSRADNRYSKTSSNRSIRWGFAS